VKVYLNLNREGRG